MAYPASQNPDADYSLHSDVIELTERALAIHFLFTREAAQRFATRIGCQRRHDQTDLTPRVAIFPSSRLTQRRRPLRRAPCMTCCGPSPSRKARP
jgi:hypothetical protein